MIEWVLVAITVFHSSVMIQEVRRFDSSDTCLRAQTALSVGLERTTADHNTLYFCIQRHPQQGEVTGG